jgi:hypothetical protein
MIEGAALSNGMLDHLATSTVRSSCFCATWRRDHSADRWRCRMALMTDRSALRICIGVHLVR